MSSLKATISQSRVYGTKDSSIGQETVTRGKGPAKSLQELHAEIVRNIQSTNIGKPTIVEAQRILKIIENLQTNLEVFQYLDVDFISKFLDLQKGNKLAKELVQQLSPQCLQLLKEQAEYETKYKPYAAFEQQQKDGEEENQEEDKEKLIEKEKIYSQLENNFKNLLRYVKEHPEDYKIIQDLKPNVNQDIIDLKHCMECWRIIYLKQLSTAYEEQESHVQQTKILQERIKRLKKSQESCEKDQRDLKADRDQFKKEKSEELAKLKDAIQEVRLEEENDKKRLDDEIKKQRTQRNKEHEQKCQEYAKQKQECKENFEKEKKQNQDQENKMKINKASLESRLADAINTYDLTMEEKMKEKKQLEDELDEIKKQLYHLKKHFKAIEEERAREEEVENIFRQKREKHEIHEKRKHAAASHVQIAYKRFKESKGKKKGKKGKKK